MEENQPGTHSRGHPDSIHPLSHHAACSQPSLEEDSPVSHISWSSYNTHTHTHSIREPVILVGSLAWKRGREQTNQNQIL